MSSQTDHTGEAVLELDPFYAKTLDLEAKKKVSFLSSYWNIADSIGQYSSAFKSPLCSYSSP